MATAGALTWSHAGGGRHLRNRPSLSYSAASNSSFMLGKVDEEDGHIDAALGEAVSSTQNSCVPAMNPLQPHLQFLVLIYCMPFQPKGQSNISGNRLCRSKSPALQLTKVSHVRWVQAV
jgi:hypothetical protein